MLVYTRKNKLKTKYWNEYRYKGQCRYTAEDVVLCVRYFDVSPAVDPELYPIFPFVIARLHHDKGKTGIPLAPLFTLQFHGFQVNTRPA